MKKLYNKGLLVFLLMVNFTSGAYAKQPTVYGVHDPIDTNLGGIEWIFILASLVFFTGLILLVNGRSLKNKLS